jgi:hypothetical protein
VILSNYPVNPSGLVSHWHARDLLQEHQNLKLKNIFNSKLNPFDLAFLCETVLLNILPMSALKGDFTEKLGLSPGHPGWAQADIEADINYLGCTYLVDCHHVYVPGRLQGFEASDAFARGGEKLAGGVLDQFTNKYIDE